MLQKITFRQNEVKFEVNMHEEKWETIWQKKNKFQSILIGKAVNCITKMDSAMS